MSSLADLLAKPSVESWKAIVEIGKKARKIPDPNRDGLSWAAFTATVRTDIQDWPPEIERVCPEGWPKEFREAVEHRVRETDTYGHYLAKICGHPDLRLADGSQAVWLERRFTGGVVPVSTAQSALRLLTAALAASSTMGMTARVKQAINLLASGVRNVGKVGCADLTGGVVVEVQPFKGTGDERIWRHEYRLEVEIKVGDEPQRPEQVVRMRNVRARGGCYVLARSVEDAVAQIKAFIEGTDR
jgi:hypothetical protein